MKKTYTKKQITEAIAYWKNVLKENYNTSVIDLLTSSIVTFRFHDIDVKYINKARKQAYCNSIDGKAAIHSRSIYNSIGSFITATFTQNIDLASKISKRSVQELRLEFKNAQRIAKADEIVVFDCRLTNAGPETNKFITVLKSIIEYGEILDVSSNINEQKNADIKKKLNEDTNEKNAVTVVPIVSILEKADKFDFCGSWPGNGSFVWGIKFSQDSIRQLNSAFAKYQGSSYNKFICLNKVLSRSQFDEQAEYYNNIPYEHYIDDAKFVIQEAFDDYPILEALKPCDMIIVDDVVANDKPGCSFIAALYVFQ